MTTLAEIENVKAYHLPVPGAEPVVLSTGTLYLSVIPANPPSHPSQTLALSVGASSFPVLPNTPIQKIEAKEEHPRYAFSPLPADGGAAIGRVKIVLGPRFVSLLDLGVELMVVQTRLNGNRLSYLLRSLRTL
jgi:hypothetical protein